MTLQGLNFTNLLTTNETGDKHWPCEPLGAGKDFTFWFLACKGTYAFNLVYVCVCVCDAGLCTRHVNKDMMYHDQTWWTWIAHGERKIPIVFYARKRLQRSVRGLNGKY